MSSILIDAEPVGTYSSGRQNCVGLVYCDTQTDLPGADDFTCHLMLGSKAEVMDGTVWRMKSDGTWEQQPAPNTTQLDLSGYYTTAQVDALDAGLQSQIDLTYKLNTSTVLADPDPDNGVYADLWDTTLPFGTYLRSSNVSNVQHLPTGFTGGFKVIIERGLTNARRVLTLFKVSGTGSVGDEFYRCILGTGGTGTWYKYTGTAV